MKNARVPRAGRALSIAHNLTKYYCGVTLRQVEKEERNWEHMWGSKKQLSIQFDPLVFALALSQRLDSCHSTESAAPIDEAKQRTNALLIANKN